MKQIESGLSIRHMMKRAENALQKQDGDTALALYRQVVTVNPNHAEALYQIGYIAHCTGNYQYAQDYYQRCIQADPNYVDGYLMLSALLEEQGQAEPAVQIAHLAAQMAPENSRAHRELASVLIRFNQAHLAVSYLDEILPRFPKDVKLLQVYCMALKINERTDEADIAYDKLINELHAPFSSRVLYETYLPRLYRTDEEIDKVRAKFKESLELFIKRKVQFNADDMKYEPVFQLAFHNRDNKELLQLYTKMLRSMAPMLNYTAPHCKANLVRREGKIRVGFISRHMNIHSVGNCYRDVMIAIAQDPAFDVTLFQINTVYDSAIQQIMDAGVPIVTLPKNISAARDMIAPYQFDIIIYPDIGMDAMTRYLAMARMAPHQLCFQGHPETTGIDTIDYIVSSRSYEPPHADENYTERLLCNEGIDTVFKRPEAPAHWTTREEFMMLPPDKKLYVCPMAIQKFHPEFDDVLADILKADPNAVLVLFQDFQQISASQLMQERIFQKCPRDRIVFMPWLNKENFYSILKLADVILDTIHFGGGTTAQIAFHFGFPIVTMPGNWARGRVVYSYYSIMGVPDAPVAKDTKEYVELAVKLANDKAYADKISKEILARGAAIFEVSPYGPKAIQLLHDIMDQNLEAYKR